MIGDFKDPGAAQRKITFSAAKRWFQCRRQWYYRYIGQMRSPGNLPMMEGTLLHLLLEDEARLNLSHQQGGGAQYEGRQRAQDPIGYALHRSREVEPIILSWLGECLEPFAGPNSEGAGLSYTEEDLYKAADLNREVFKNWLRVHGASDLLRYLIVSVEFQYTHRLLNRYKKKIRGWVQGGKIDLVLRDQETGQTIIREYKTTSGNTEDYERRVTLDPQIRIYANAIKEAGLIGVDLYPDCIQYGVIRRKIPSLPNDVKCKSCKGKGEVKAGTCAACAGQKEIPSATTRLDSVDVVVAEYLKGRGYNIEGAPYAELIEALPGWERYFSLTTHYLEPFDIEETMVELTRAAQEIHGAVKEFSETGDVAHNFPRNVSHCSGPTGFCDYRIPCSSRMKAEELSTRFGFVEAADHPELEEKK